MLEESIIEKILKTYNVEVDTDKQWILGIAVVGEELKKVEEKLKEVYDPREETSLEIRVIIKRYSLKRVNVNKVKLKITNKENRIKKIKVEENMVEFKSKTVEEAIKLISAGRDRQSREIIHLDLRDKQYR